MYIGNDQQINFLKNGDISMLEQINEIIEKEIQPSLASHGGGIEVEKYEDQKLYVRLSGGCQGCPGARMTIKNGVERILKSKIEEIKEVIDVTSH